MRINDFYGRGIQESRLRLDPDFHRDGMEWDGLENKNASAKTEAF
jgi:hypothetical protein